MLDTEANVAVLTKTCECADSGCPMHMGESRCPVEITPMTETVVYRIDMNDETGTSMCEGCADDALDSGLFTTD